VATLVYLYGPPAAGKLTVAEALVAETGFRLFHNHLSVNAVASVFEFATVPFGELLHRFRLDVFETAMRSGIDVIFTNNSAWTGPDPRPRFVAFARQAEELVVAAGGQVLFVQLTAPPEILEARLPAASRVAHRKLTDPGRLRELLARHDPAPLHADDLRIDTSEVSPRDAARQIAEAAARCRRSS
jgi:chloramphenicol 3-O-phosphotransferase